MYFFLYYRKVYYNMSKAVRPSSFSFCVVTTSGTSSVAFDLVITTLFNIITNS